MLCEMEVCAFRGRQASASLVITGMRKSGDRALDPLRGGAPHVPRNFEFKLAA